jgi:cobalt/nickel transport system permease protein
MTFIERTLKGLLSTSQYAASAEEMASGAGLLQSVDPRVKIVGLFALVLVAASARQLRIVAALFILAVLLTLSSRIAVTRVAGRIWLPVLLFTGTIALPSVFLAGWRSAAFLLSRAETCATLSALLVMTTSWPRVLRALRALRCPALIVVMLGMTYRYIFVVLQTAFEMLESRKSRTVGTMAPAERRRLATASIGVLLSKSLQLSGDVHLAMQSRGFRGEARVLEDFHTRTSDWLWLSGFGILAALAFWWQR